MLSRWMLDFVTVTADWLGTEPFVVKPVLAVFLVCLLCGMVGSLVVGNRMAFFSDAMAHCAFAGVALGYLAALAGGVGRDAEATGRVVALVMILFGAGVGAAIVTVREQTGLAADTVIGVFFAFAIGAGAMLLPVLRAVSTFSPDAFLFGSLLFLPEQDLAHLVLLVLAVAGLYAWRYNRLVFASFNPSLARTRRVGLRLNNYLFIVLLALVVNLSIKAVGALLINALLVVPAAAAANVSRNLRQMFWLTVGFCVASGLVGFYLSTAVSVRVAGAKVQFGPSGTVVVVAVGLFFGSVLWGPGRRLARTVGGRASRLIAG